MQQNASYNQDYNRGWNDAYLSQQSQPSKTIRVDQLDDDKLWYNRLHSAGYMLGMIVIALIAIACVYGLLRYIFLDLLHTGISSYEMIAPGLLLIILGFYIGKRR